jgi:hypothetical protein
MLALALPWWNIAMFAPQYPYGLHVTTWFFGVTGDVSEVDELNHYIGFMPLATVAIVERKLALFLGPVIALLLIVPALVRARFAALAAIPAVTVPAVFLADLAVWLSYAGHHLDPHAALSSSVAPWTPVLLGAGGVGQFHTYGALSWGFWLAVAAAALAIDAIIVRLRTAAAR